MKRHSFIFLGAAMLTGLLGQQSRVGSKETKLDRMIAAGKSQRELAQYVFDTHGCKSCHTVGQDGKLGFTGSGEQTAQGYEGCISLLTAMKLMATVPDEKRSSEQRQKSEHFVEFGCTACHQTTGGKIALTSLGQKLTRLHLGCVDVEKLTSSR